MNEQEKYLAEFFKQKNFNQEPPQEEISEKVSNLLVFLAVIFFGIFTITSTLGLIKLAVTIENVLKDGTATNAISNLSISDYGIGWFLIFIIGILLGITSFILLIVDRFKVKNTGHIIRFQLFWVVFLSPVYLFRRAIRLKKSKDLAIIFTLVVILHLGALSLSAYKISFDIAFSLTTKNLNEAEISAEELYIKGAESSLGEDEYILESGTYVAGKDIPIGMVMMINDPYFIPSYSTTTTPTSSENVEVNPEEFNGLEEVTVYEHYLVEGSEINVQEGLVMLMYIEVEEAATDNIKN